MGNLGSGEMLVIFLLALLVLGPERLPEMARKIGGFVRQVRSMSSGFQQEVRNAINSVEEPFTPEERRIRALPAPDPDPEPPVASGAADDLETDVRARNDRTG